VTKLGKAENAIINAAADGLNTVVEYGEASMVQS
jgi:hypothetical protein